jgi:ABC-type Mn2+/Zn2+ transport system permease subunit
MMGQSISVAAAFIWLGMVLAISFLEAPLKFRAPGVTLQLGLGIGRLVFRALNACEVVLAAVILVGCALDRPSTAALVALVVAVAALVVQLAAVRPALTRRSDRVLAGSDGGQSRSRVHYAYVAFELVKVAALVTAGILLVGGLS